MRSSYIQQMSPTPVGLHYSVQQLSVLQPLRFKAEVPSKSPPPDSKDVDDRKQHSGEEGFEACQKPGTKEKRTPSYPNTIPQKRFPPSV